MEASIPFDISAERAVLGACLLDRDAITVIRDILSIEDFYLEKNALVYRALLDLVDRRIAPDLVTVAGQLRDNGHFDDIGGNLYLSELMAETPTAVHADNYANRVLQTSAQRRIIQLGAEIQIRGHEGGDLESIYSELQARLEVTRQASTPKSKWEEAVVSARALYKHKFEVVPFTIKDILPPGTMLLAGKPKTYKSWLALNLAIAVASGGKAMSKYEATPGDVLYIDLEMGAARIHKRLHVVSPNADPPRGLKFATKWPPVGEGFETWLRDYLKSHPYTRLVVIDTMVGIRAPRKRYEDPYEADKRFAQSLTNLCQDYRISMLLIHHSRKADGSDVLDDISGSTGLPGGVDNTAILRLVKGKRGAGELFLRGRDIEIQGDLNLKWDQRLAQWNAVDDDERSGPSLTPERKEVLELLRDRPGLKPKQIAVILDRDEPGTRRLLGNMAADGLLSSAQGGFWYVADDEDNEDEDAVAV